MRCYEVELDKGKRITGSSNINQWKQILRDNNKRKKEEEKKNTNVYSARKKR